jgi:DNA segregation ATPase FtsK/SpoIIIE, S-DNA-T family
MTRSNQEAAPRRMLAPISGMAACLFFWAALLTFSAGDWPSPHRFPHNVPTQNACGQVGSWAAFHLLHLLGDGVYPMLLFFTLAAILRLVHGHIVHLAERLLGLVLVVLCTSTSVHLMFSAGPGTLPAGHGGLLGFELGELMNRNLSGIGSALIIVSSLIVGIIFAAQEWMLRLPSLFTKAASASSEAINVARQLANAVPRLQPAAGPRGSFHSEREPREARVRKSKRTLEQDELDFEKESNEAPDEELVSRAEKNDREEPRAKEAGGLNPNKSADAKPAAGTATEKPAAIVQIPKPAGGLIVRFPTPQRMASSEPYPKQIENWRLPDLGLLQEPEFGFSAQQEGIVRKQAKVLEETLQEFRLDAQVVEIDTGPVITMFEIRLGAGIKVSQIASLSNDIARALKAHAIRVVAPIPGKNTVGIEVPNLVKEKVRMKELMTLGGKKASEMALPLFLGKDAAGAALALDLAAMPHMLIAGTTGSGKSVCLNAIILSLLMTKRPDHVKMILIDPKMVEMSQYKEVPHLMCPLVTDMAKAEKILEWAVTQMDERYEWLSEARVRNIAGYNALGAEELFTRLKATTDGEKAVIPIFMPYIVIVIDELADLMMTSAKEVEHHLSRLAQKSRAVGVHIIVATQRPEVKVVTGLIKSNLPARVCFRVASRMDSRIVLDQNGGEVLMGQGDMLLLPPGSHKLLRAQGTYLEDSEIHAVLEDLASRSKPEFHPDLMKIKTVEAEAGDDMRDPLFDDAVRIILESKRGSVSLLQRRLTIGYSRASRLIDQMAAAGIVGDYKGSQAREVVMTLEEWDAMRSSVANDMTKGYAADQDIVDDADEVFA